MNIKLAILAALISSVPLIQAAPVKPVVLSTRGQPSMTLGGSSSPLELKQSLSAGVIIETDKSSKVAVAIAPGQMVVLENRTTLKIISIHDTAASRGAVIELVGGSASFYIDPKYGQSGPVFELIAGTDSIKASGTTWTSSRNGNTFSHTVTSSAVNITPAGTNTPFNVPAGSVVTSVYGPNGAWQGSTVVDLTTGKATGYSPQASGAELTVSTGLATGVQMDGAAVTFQAAITAVFTNALLTAFGVTDLAAKTAVIVAAINAVLVANGSTVTVTTPGGSTTAGGGTTGNTNTRDTITAVSEERP